MRRHRSVSSSESTLAAVTLVAGVLDSAPPSTVAILTPSSRQVRRLHARRRSALLHQWMSHAPRTREREGRRVAVHARSDPGSLRATVALQAALRWTARSGATRTVGTRARAAARGVPNGAAIAADVPCRLSTRVIEGRRPASRSWIHPGTGAHGDHHVSALPHPVSYTHLTLPTTPYV